MQLSNPGARPSEVNDMVLITGRLNNAEMRLHVKWDDAIRFSAAIERAAEIVRDRCGGNAAESAVGRPG